MHLHAEFKADNGLLTDAETKVLARIAEGHSRDEVAELLHRSSCTINTHLHRAIDKLEAKNGLHAVAIAIVRGIIKIEQVICLVLVVGLSSAAVSPSAAYASDLANVDFTEQPLVRTGRIRLRSRSGGRSGRRRED